MVWRKNEIRGYLTTSGILARNNGIKILTIFFMGGLI